MKIRSVISIVSAAVLIVTLAACTKPSSTQQPPDDGTAPITTYTTAPLLSIDLRGVLKAEDITQIIGVPMKDPVVSGQGSGLVCFAKDPEEGSDETPNTSQVIIDVEEQSREYFDSGLAYYDDLIACPNLGESAWFCSTESHRQLLVYDNDRIFIIQVFVDGEEDEETILFYSRQIALLLLGRL